MIFSDSVLFALSLIDTGAILFLLIYFIITLSDLECDYLNSQECCNKLNYWLLPKYIAHGLLTLMFLFHSRVILLLLNCCMFVYLTFEYFTVPAGNIGAFDPAEIHNRGLLKKHMRNFMINIGFYLILFFVYLYCFIIAVLTSSVPVFPNSSEYEIVTNLG